MKNNKKSIHMLCLGLIIGFASQTINTTDIIKETGNAINKSNKKIAQTFSNIGHTAKILSPARVTSDIELMSLIFGEIGDIINTTEQALQNYSEPISSIQELFSLIKTIQELVRVINPTILLIEEQCYQLEDNFK